jgi:hypothetical protein
VHRGNICTTLRVCAVVMAALAAAAATSRASECPDDGASLRVALQASPGAPPTTATVFGFVTAPSCDDGAQRLADIYAQTVRCNPAIPEQCAVTVEGLHPGRWTHRIIVSDGEPVGQYQGRTQLLLDRSAGPQALVWPLYRSVHTVLGLDDDLNCTGCLRAAITGANLGLKPALIQFAPELSGTVRLTAALPPIATDQVTLDGLTVDGTPLSRAIDGNGIDAAALRITGGRCAVLGLRIANAGGDSDVVLLEGPAANDNVLDSLQVVGRAGQVCGTNGSGCVIGGVCREPTAQNPDGFCGDDGIAVRALAGTGGVNQIRHCLISAAHDKGVKVSDGGAALVADSTIFGNTDGGLQATLSGQLSAERNYVIANLGTTSANGLAANGAAVGSTQPARLETRGNLSIGNSLRGISVRSLSQATLRDDFVCANAAGVVLLDAAGSSAAASASGLAVVHNRTNGVIVSDASRLSFGDVARPGVNAVAFNGPTSPRSPVNFRNLTALPITAVGNAWEHCGPRAPCDLAGVQALDVFTTSPLAPVDIAPAQPTRRRAAPSITAIQPSFAAAGELIRIYGDGFDAIDGIGPACDTPIEVNTCRPLRGNCVLIDRVAAEVIAVTPTMLVVRAPFTCVAPVRASVRTRWGHGFAHAPFCTAP